jgi:hypothetical protein
MASWLDHMTEIINCITGILVQLMTIPFRVLQNFFSLSDIWTDSTGNVVSPNNVLSAQIFNKIYTIVKFKTRNVVWTYISLLFPSLDPLFRFLYPTQVDATKLCGYYVFDSSVGPCVIICCSQDSDYICWWIDTKLWEVVSNSKRMDGIDFQKNLSRESLFLEGDLVKFVS